MKLFNFSACIIKWIKNFHKDITTINQGGKISRWFKDRRGCRQGGPISPRLFLLCAEILAIKLRGNNELMVSELHVLGNIMHLISQFTDNTSLFFDGTKNSLENALNELKDFREISGLSVSCENCENICMTYEKNGIVKREGRDRQETRAKLI